MSTISKVKKSAAKKPKASKSVSHPSYFEMIKEAILALKEKTGSSPYAIAKYMEQKHKVLPPNFRKVLAVQLKNSVAKGKLIKIKASFKLSEAGKKAAPSKKKPVAKAKVVKKPAAKAVVAKKPAAKAVVVKKPADKKKPTVAKKKAGAVKKAAKPKTKVATKKRAAPAAKPKVPKSIKSPAAKRAKRVSAKA